MTLDELVAGTETFAVGPAHGRTNDCEVDDCDLSIDWAAVVTGLKRLVPVCDKHRNIIEARQRGKETNNAE